MSYNSFGNRNSFKENKSKKKNLAPFPKQRKVNLPKQVENDAVDEFEFTDDVLDEVFQDVLEVGKTETQSEHQDIDLEDWIPASLKKTNAQVRKTEKAWSSEKSLQPTPSSSSNATLSSFKTIPYSSSSTTLTSLKTLHGSSSYILSSDVLNIRKEMLFSSKEFEEDSTLRLRFLKRDVPASRIKELSGSAQMVPLVDALKFCGTKSKDWFVAGVVSEYRELRKSGSGRIDLTDLAAEPCSVKFLLFNAAYSSVRKLSVGTIVCISNPTKAKPYNGKEALVVNNAEQVLVAGMSRDYGLCSGKKKVGGPCHAVVNLNICRYCRFHAMSEYKQQRVAKDIKAAAAGVGFGAKKTAAPGLWNAKASIAGSLKPAKKNLVQLQKDKDRLDKLSASTNGVQSTGTSASSWRRAHFLSGPSSASQATEKRKFSALEEDSTPKNSMKMNFIEPSVTHPASAQSSSPKMSSAKRRALLFARENGGISKTTPKPIMKPSEAEQPVRPAGITDEFLALMKQAPRDPTLLNDAEALDRDRRFDRLQVVEEISEKLVATHEVPVRAIRCLVCKKSFHQMPLQCVMNKHECRVVTGTKRFFECNSCRTRTTTLERLPAAECSKCGVWSWKRAGVAADRVCSVAAPLSVRGLEEKFIGSIASDPNLSLLVPETISTN